MANIELDEKIGTAVKVQDDEFYWYAPASAKNLTNKEKFARLTESERDQILDGAKTVADFFDARNETPVDGKEALAEMRAFLDRYQGPVSETEDAMKIVAVRCLATDDDPVEIQSLTGATFATLTSWCAPTFKGKTDKKVDQKILNAIKKAGEAAKAARLSR